MATTYVGWVADGRPWDPAHPVDALTTCLRRYGYTCYVLGNQEHATADPPEDHMPYSHTPWPGRQPYPFVLACDIMPPPAGKGLPSLAQLGAQLYADKQAGHPGVAWLKYMNWEPSGSRGPCYHDSWQPGHARSASTDRGHIHLSGRTDFVTSDSADGYDPIARIRGDDMAGTGIIGLTKGDKGENVQALQVILESTGFLAKGGYTSSTYDSATSAALLKLRKSVGSSATSGDTVDAWAHHQVFYVLALQVAQQHGAPGPKGDQGPAGPQGPKGDAAVLAPGSTLTVNG